jgi:hypothetical protein
MSHDHVGALELPVNTRDLPIGDPLLGILGAFMQAAIRKGCSRAWQEIGGGTDVCERVEYNDPNDNTFSITKLPALFLFRDRESSTEEWLADELCELKSEVTALWVLPVGVQYWRAIRSPFVHAIHGSLGRAFRDDCVQGYFVRGETDPLALLQGSSLLQAASLMRPILTIRVKPTVVEVKVNKLEGADATRYPAVQIQIPISERETLFAENDPTVPAKLDASGSANANITVATMDTAAEAEQFRRDVA